jgi:hypothetical protein
LQPRDCPVDLCSHKRSGTHFLAATLNLNFDLGDLELSAIIRAGYRFQNGDLKWGPGQRAIVPWGQLWSSHNFFNPKWRSRDRTLYIVRNPVDTLMSYWRFVDPEMKDPAEKYVGPARVRFWLRHARGYSNGGCYVVRYEDLLGPEHDRVLDGIGERFGLKRRRSGYERFTRRIGWYSAAKPRQPKRVPAWLLENIRAGVPDGFMGYHV